MHSNRRFSAVLAALLLVGHAGGHGARAAEPPAPQSVAELRARVERILADEGLPGVAFAVVRAGELEYAGGVGRANLADGRAVTAETPFRVASVTKTFVALAILELCEQGKLSLDTKLRDIAPEIAAPNRWESMHPVRIAHLLEHTAGFDDQRPCEMVSPPGPEPTLRQLLAACPASHRPRWPPGTRKSYSNTGYTVAGYVLEKVTGRAYEDALRDLLLAPLGMTHASARMTPDVRAALAQGYGRDGRAVPPLPIAQRPSGALIASAGELAQLVRLLIARGKIDDRQLLSAASIARSERTETLPYDGYGSLIRQYGLGNFGYPTLGFVVHGHDGDFVGFHAEYGYEPQQRFGWVVLFNSDQKQEVQSRIVDLVAAFATRGLERPTPPLPVELPAASLTELAGYYRQASSRSEYLRLPNELLGGRSIIVDGGALYGERFGGPRERLLPLSARQFRREADPGTTFLFTRADDGTAALVVGDTYYEAASPWLVWLHRTALLLALALALSSLLYGLAWGVRLGLSARLRVASRLAVRGLPALAGLLLLALAWSLWLTTEAVLTSAWSAPTVAFFVCSLVYPACAVAALVVTARSWLVPSPLGRGERLYALAVALAHLGLCAELLAYGFLGYRAWVC